MNKVFSILNRNEGGKGSALACCIDFLLLLGQKSSAAAGDAEQTSKPFSNRSVMISVKSCKPWGVISALSTSSRYWWWGRQYYQDTPVPSWHNGSSFNDFRHLLTLPIKVAEALVNVIERLNVIRRNAIVEPSRFGLFYDDCYIWLKPKRHLGSYYLGHLVFTHIKTQSHLLPQDHLSLRRKDFLASKGTEISVHTGDDVVKIRCYTQTTGCVGIILHSPLLTVLVSQRNFISCGSKSNNFCTALWSSSCLQIFHH